MLDGTIGEVHEPTKKETAMKHIDLDGIGSLIPFLQILDAEKTSYRIGRSRDDSIFITITTGKRIEVDFFQDHIEYGWFGGSEAVHDDQRWLHRTLEGFVRDQPHGARAPSPLRALAKLVKNSSAYFLATPLIRRPPSWAILPPTLASTS